MKFDNKLHKVAVNVTSDCAGVFKKYLDYYEISNHMNPNSKTFENCFHNNNLCFYFSEDEIKCILTKDFCIKKDIKIINITEFRNIVDDYLKSKIKFTDDEIEFCKIMMLNDYQFISKDGHNKIIFSITEPYKIYSRWASGGDWISTDELNLVDNLKFDGIQWSDERALNLKYICKTPLGLDQ